MASNKTVWFHISSHNLCLSTWMCAFQTILWGHIFFAAKINNRLYVYELTNICDSTKRHIYIWRERKNERRTHRGERDFIKLVGVITIRFSLFTLTIETRSLYMSNIWVKCWHVIFHSTFFVYVCFDMNVTQCSRIIFWAIWFWMKFFSLFLFFYLVTQLVQIHLEANVANNRKANKNLSFLRPIW